MKHDPNRGSRRQGALCKKRIRVLFTPRKDDEPRQSGSHLLGQFEEKIHGLLTTAGAIVLHLNKPNNCFGGKSDEVHPFGTAGETVEVLLLERRIVVLADLPSVRKTKTQGAFIQATHSSLPLTPRNNVQSAEYLHPGVPMDPALPENQPGQPKPLLLFSQDQSIETARIDPLASE